MQRVGILVLAAVLAVSCSGKKPVPAGRLMQPAGRFSLVTPDGWYRSRVSGIDFVVVSSDPDHGVTPNIFVDGVPRRGRVADQARALAGADTLLSQADFATASGLQGTRLLVRRATSDGVPVVACHFLIQDGERVIAITCSCAEAVRETYAPLFDEAMRSLRVEP